MQVADHDALTMLQVMVIIFKMAHMLQNVAKDSHRFADHGQNIAEDAYSVKDGYNVQIMP